MARKKHTSVRKYNPEKFMAEMTDLAAQSPQDAAEVAATWRERFHNAMEESSRVTQKAIGIGVAGGTSFLVAMLDGRWEAEKEDLIAKWMASPEAAAAASEAGIAVDETSPFIHGEESDPTKIFGIDRVMIATLLLAAAAVTNLAKQYTPFVEAGAIGCAAYWAGSIGFRVGKEQKEEALEAEASEAAA